MMWSWVRPDGPVTESAPGTVNLVSAPPNPATLTTQWYYSGSHWANCDCDSAWLSTMNGDRATAGATVADC